MTIPIDLEALRDVVPALREIDRYDLATGVAALLTELTTRRARDAEVEALVAAAKRANGDHSAPDDCYSTGPLTGDDHLDYVSCPGCELAAALANLTGAKP